MRRTQTVLYARREFQIEQADRVNELGLLIDFADAFIAYVNGQEVARSGVGRSSGRNAQNVKARDQKGRLYFGLKDARKHLRDGTNIIAIEAHNSTADRIDFLLDPAVVAED